MAKSLIKFRKGTIKKMGVKVIDGRSLKYKPLGGTPAPAVLSVGVAYTSKDNPDHSVILERISDFHQDDLPEQDEVWYIIDGEGSLTCDGKTQHFHQGDIVLVTRGSKVHYDIDYVASVFFTYPPVDKAWPELGEESRRPQAP